MRISKKNVPAWMKQKVADDSMELQEKLTSVTAGGKATKICRELFSRFEKVIIEVVTDPLYTSTRIFEHWCEGDAYNGR
jgi:hypothetical protein